MIGWWWCIIRVTASTVDLAQLSRVNGRVGLVEDGVTRSGAGGVTCVLAKCTLITILISEASGGNVLEAVRVLARVGHLFWLVIIGWVALTLKLIS